MKLAIDERSCTRARRALSLVLDGEAAAVDVLVAAMHIRRCEPCQRLSAQVVAFTRELRSARLERFGDPGEIDHGKGDTS